jgi:hypothetical protein
MDRRDAVASVQTRRAELLLAVGRRRKVAGVVIGFGVKTKP